MEQRIKDFVYAVQVMRERQKLYFATRSPSALQGSKEQERKVDNMIKEFYEDELKLF